MMRCVIVDDKPLAIDILTDYVAKVPFMELTFSSTNPLEALNHVMEGNTDLVFLDIQMPELSGLQFIKITQGKCKVIFTTAYSEFAVEGFDNDAVDYLLKPISFERFYQSAKKAQLALQGTMVQHPPVENLTPPAPKVAEYIFVKTEYKLVKVSIAEILYIEGMQNYVTIHTLDHKIMCLQSLKRTEEQLPASQFRRVHKSYIVAIGMINSIERNRITIGKAIIPLGDVYRDAFFKTIDSK
jgi:two-component system LytT family response regulator